jgi:non-heme chloroperoxidase
VPVEEPSTASLTDIGQIYSIGSPATRARLHGTGSLEYCEYRQRQSISFNKVSSCAGKLSAKLTRLGPVALPVVLGIAPLGPAYREDPIREEWTMKIHTVKGAAGINLHVREYGKSTGIPILLIHGWSQNHLCWSKQYDSALKDDARIVALDLRGHGMSDAPEEVNQYTDGDKWADDLAAVIDELALDRTILVGWSYGGYIIADYVRRKGQSKIAGINFVGAAVVLGPKAFGPLLGPGFLENAPGACQDDVPTNIAAIRRFLRACVVKPISQNDLEEALAYNMVVRPSVRRAMTQRELDFASLLQGITVPVLVTHGRSDTVVLPSMADYILNHCRTAEASWYDGVGHAPFLEEPLRFNSELKQFAARAYHARLQ